MQLTLQLRFAGLLLAKKTKLRPQDLPASQNQAKSALSACCSSAPKRRDYCCGLSRIHAGCRTRDLDRVFHDSFSGEESREMGGRSRPSLISGH